MRILHLVHQFGPHHVGGTEIYTEALARQQTAQGHAVAIFTRAPGPAPRLTTTVEGEVTVARWESPPLSPLGEFRALLGDGAVEAAFADLLARWRPDLLHVQHLKGLPVGLVGQARVADARLVATLHDYWLVCANAQLITNTDGRCCAGPRLWLNCARCAAARLGQPALGALAPLGALPLAARAARLRAVSRTFDRIIAPSHFVRDLMSAQGLAATRLAVIRHGIALPDSLPAPRPRRGPLRVTYLGGLAWQKGVHVVVAAAAALDPARVRLTLYGDEGAFPDYVAALRRDGRGAVRFGGRLDRAAVWEALAASDLLVVPSLWHETAGLVVQEALASRVPVLASEIGALPEAVAHDETGLLLPPGDVAAWRTALDALAGDEPRLARWRAAIGPVRTLADHAADVAACYAALCSTGGQVA